MQIFITGTDTNVGKTLVCSWLCLHSKYKYIKPIQTGSIENTDSEFISSFIDKNNIFKEVYKYKEPLAPYLASKLEQDTISIENITLPKSKNLIVEGAGGIMVPLNNKFFILDLIKILDLPVIIVARSTLGTINHTLLSLTALKNHNIRILGVILSGYINKENKQAIEYYGNTKVLAELPYLEEITKEALLSVPLPESLNNLLKTVT